MNLSRFEALTFDCYGTLIDWETGILGALRPVLSRHGVEMADEELLALYAELEPAAEAPPYRPYREVLVDVVAGIGQHLSFEPSPGELRCLVDSLGHWPPFPDTVDALRLLGGPFRLGIVSNTDVDLFRRTSEHLGVRFDPVLTAQEARAYKPDPRPFELALERIGAPRERVLHVAQSLFHDVIPAKALGLACVWVNRRAGRAGTGATPPAAVLETGEARPDLVVPDLASLVGRLGLK
ncbi:MAG: haloacid dehalogenase type II [Gemmatimonadota bacterium]